VTRCGVCAAPIQQPATGRPRVYSDDACRQRACRAARRVTKPEGAKRPGLPGTVKRPRKARKARPMRRAA